jgi:serine/threonine-protein kinase
MAPPRGSTDPVVMAPPRGSTDPVVMAPPRGSTDPVVMAPPRGSTDPVVVARPRTDPAVGSLLARADPPLVPELLPPFVTGFVPGARAPTFDTGALPATAADADGGFDAELAARWIGRVIDERYRIVEVLGEGGMGAVFVAEHLKLRKQVALKTIRSEFSGDPQLEARFSREALATAQIEHPHVASAMDYGHLPEGGAYLVIQLVRGESLGKRLERGPLSWAAAAELGAQVADALSAAHAAGIIHRDLKPDNILIEPRDGANFAKVVDFGIARLSDDSGAVVVGGAQPITRMGTVIGTPGYMAPEQAVAGQIDARVDLYALGVILWECCAGRRLWEGDNLTELFTRQLTVPPPELRTVVPGVPPALSALVAQLLAAQPAKRPATPALVRDELRAVLRGEDLAVAARSLGSMRVSGDPTALVEVMTGIREPGFVGALKTAIGAALPAPARGRPLPWVLGGAAAVLLVSALVARCACGGAGPEAPADGPAPAVAGPPETPPPPPADAPPRPEEPPMPAAYAEHARVLLAETNARARKKAAEAITDASDEDKQKIPMYVRNVAWLERNVGCDKKSVLEKISAEADPRALPALKILAATRRDGCREFLFASDCLECIREELARVIGRLEARAAPP